jgi:hypothetical protein
MKGPSYETVIVRRAPRADGPEVVRRVVSVTAASAAYRQVLTDAVCDEDIVDGLGILAFEIAKTETGYLHAEKVRSVELNDARTIAGVCLNVHGWYVRCTVCLITRTLFSVDDERRPSLRGAA